MKGLGSSILKVISVIVLMIVLSMMTMCTMIIVDDETYSKSESENSNVNSNYSASDDSIENTFYNLYYKKYASESFYYTLEDLKDTPDSDFSNLTYEELLNIQEDSETAESLLSINGLNQASLEQVIKDADNYEENLTLDYLKLEKFDEFLNLNKSGYGYTDPSSLIKPLATTCDLSNPEINIKECELEKIYDSEKDSVLMDSQKYNSTEAGYKVVEGSTEKSLSDYGLGSLVNYTAFYQPSKIENYNFVKMKTVNQNLSYKDLSEDNVYEYLSPYEIEQKHFDLYSKDSSSFVAPAGSYATGYYRPESTIYYKDWIIGAEKGGSIDTVNSYLENNYSVLGYSTKEEAWAKVQAAVSSGIPVTTVSYLIDYAVTMFGTYDFGINEDWTYLTDSFNTETTFYFKEYSDPIYSASIKDVGRDAARYKGVYDQSNNLLGYIKDSENPVFTPVVYTKVKVVPDTYSEAYYVCVKQITDPITGTSRTEETKGSCTDGGTTETRYETKNNKSNCKNGMESCTLIESDAKKHTKTPDGNFYDFRVNNGCTDNYGCWNFHLALNSDKEWIDENIELTGNTNNYNSSAYYTSRLDLAKVDRTSSMKSPTFAGFYLHPAYLFTLTSKLKGELQMRIASHASANVSTNEDDNSMYIKSYMKKYENYVPANNSNYICTEDMNSLEGRQVLDKGMCTKDEYAFAESNYGNTIIGEMSYTSLSEKHRETLSNKLGIGTEEDEKSNFSNQTLLKNDQKNFDNLASVLQRYSMALKNTTGLTGVDSNLLAMLIAEHENGFISNGTYSGYDLTKGFKEKKEIIVNDESTNAEKVMALGLFFQTLMREYNNVFPLALTAYEAYVSEGSNYTSSINAGLNEYLKAINADDVEIIYDKPYDITWYHFMPKDYSSNFFQSLEGYCFKFIIKGENDSFKAILWNKNQMKDDVNSSENDIMFSKAWFSYKKSEEKNLIWKLLTFNEEEIDKANYVSNGAIDYKIDSGFLYNKIIRLSDTQVDIDSELTTILSKPGQEWNSLNEAVINNDIAYFALSLGNLRGGVPYDRIFGFTMLEWIYDGMSGCANTGACLLDDNGDLVLTPEDGVDIYTPVGGYVEISGDSVVSITSFDGGSDYGYYNITFYGVEAADSIKNRESYCEVNADNENECSEVSAGDRIGVKVKDEVKVSLRYGKINEDGTVSHIYTENIYNKIDEYKQMSSSAAQMYINFSMFLEILGGPGTIYGDEANKIWFAINALKNAGVKIAGERYNCTAYVSYYLYMTYKDTPGFSDSVWWSAGAGFEKAELLANSNPNLFTLQHTLSEEETDWSVFSYKSKSNVNGHTGMFRTFKNEEGTWCVEVSEGNMGYNGSFGVPGTGIRNVIYSLKEWNTKYGSIDYAVKSK